MTTPIKVPFIMTADYPRQVSRAVLSPVPTVRRRGPYAPSSATVHLTPLGRPAHVVRVVATVAHLVTILVGGNLVVVPRNIVKPPL